MNSSRTDEWLILMNFFDIPQLFMHLKNFSETDMASIMWGDLILFKDLHVTYEDFLKKMLVTSS